MTSQKDAILVINYCRYEAKLIPTVVSSVKMMIIKRYEKHQSNDVSCQIYDIAKIANDKEQDIEYSR